VGVKRLFFLVVVAVAMSLGLAPSASAGNYDEERMGCAGESPATCPTGTEGQAYTIPIELLGDEDEGCAVHQVSSGTFPPGLTVNSGAARIEGTPTQAGTYRFYLTVTLFTCPYPCGSKCSSDDEFIININPGIPPKPKLTIGPESTTPGTAGTPYSLQMTASVGDPKTWTINSGSLPPGLALDAASGMISGTPTTAGTYSFEVLAKVITDERSDSKALAIVVRERLAISGSDPFTIARRAQGEVSVPFTASLAATGGEGTYTWSLTSGELPPGLLLVNGSIDGKPTTAGTYQFTATVTDAEGRVANYPARIVVAEKLAFSPLPLRPGKVGNYYSAKLRTVGGVRPATWRLVRGPLPRGLSFDRAFGEIYGTPKLPGRWRVTFEARDSLGVKAKKTLLIVVAASPLKKKSR
jgi:large repetitive protein